MSVLPLYMRCFCFCCHIFFLALRSVVILVRCCFHFLGISMMDFFRPLAQGMGKMRFFSSWGYENHARDMPRDGLAIDYYVIRGKAALFISWLPSLFYHLIFYYITKSLLVFSWWFSLSYCGWTRLFALFGCVLFEQKCVYIVIVLSDFLSLLSESIIGLNLFNHCVELVVT